MTFISSVNESDGTENQSDNVDAKEYQSAIARHLQIESVLKPIVMVVLVFCRVLGLVVTLKC